MLPSETSTRRFLRYVLTGILNTAFGYAAYAVLILLGATPLIALTLGALIGIVFNFNTTGRLVFQQKGWNPIFRYVCAWSGLLAINWILLESLDRWGIGPLPGQAICLMAIVPLGYYVMRTFVFRTPT